MSNAATRGCFHARSKRGRFSEPCEPILVSVIVGLSCRLVLGCVLAFERDEVETRIAECDNVLASEGTRTDVESRVRAVGAMAAKVYWLMECGRIAEAIDLSGELLAPCSDDVDLVTSQQIGRHVLKCGDGLVHVSADPARPVRQLRRLRPGHVVGGLAHVRSSPGLVLGAPTWARDRLRRRRQALHQGIALFDLVIARFDGAGDSESRALVLEANTHRGIALLLLGRVRAAVTLWEGLWASRASDLPGWDEMLRSEEQRASPSGIIAPLLLLKALFLRSSGQEEAGHSATAEVVRRFKRDPSRLARSVAALARWSQK